MFSAPPPELPTQGPRISEVNSDALMGIAKVLDLYCFSEHLVWLQCKADDGTSHPSTCLKEAVPVQKCAQDVLDMVASRCAYEFDDLVRCTRDNTNPNGLDNCRKEERVFYEKCVLGALLGDIKAKVPDADLLQHKLYENYGKRFGEKKPAGLPPSLRRLRE